MCQLPLSAMDELAIPGVPPVGDSEDCQFFLTAEESSGDFFSSEMP